MEADYEYQAVLGDGPPPGIERPTPDEYAECLRVIEEEARAIVEEDARFTGATAEDCAAIYSNWLKKWRHNNGRPPLKLPRPGEIGGVSTRLSSNIGQPEE